MSAVGADAGAMQVFHQTAMHEKLRMASARGEGVEPDDLDEENACVALVNAGVAEQMPDTDELPCFMLKGTVISPD